MKKTRTFFRSIAVMGKRAPIYLLAILGMSVCFSMFSVMGSLLMKQVVDIAPTGEYRQLLVSICVIVGVGFLSLLLYRASTIVYNVEAKRMFGQLAGEVLDEELHLPFSYYEKHHSGELISKISHDLERMGAIYGSRFRRVVMPVIQVIVFLVPMLVFCWQLTLCLVFINCLILLADMLMVKPIHQTNQRLSAVNKSMTEHLSDIIQGMVTIRMFRAGRRKLDLAISCNDEYYRTNKSYITKTSTLESITVGCNLLCILFFLLIGVYFVNQGITTLGALAGIYTIYGKFSNQFLMIGKYIPELSACIANAENIFEFLDEEREPKNWYADNASDRNQTIHINMDANDECALQVENISFAYEKGRSVLEDFSLTIAQNECVAITGPSGCGKTTLSKLILGLYPLESGDIFVNGRSIREHPLSEIRGDIAYVPQDAYLFNATIQENIRYGKENASDEEVERAAKMANAHEFIMATADGYHTMVQEGGVNLSGGQRQRIAIARAIISAAPIILLDEATSALDSDAEYKVNQALKNIQGKRTIVMIAHRPSTIQMADRVILIPPTPDSPPQPREAHIDSMPPYKGQGQIPPR